MKYNLTMDIEKEKVLVITNCMSRDNSGNWKKNNWSNTISQIFGYQWLIVRRQKKKSGKIDEYWMKGTIYTNEIFKENKKYA